MRNESATAAAVVPATDLAYRPRPDAGSTARSHRSGRVCYKPADCRATAFRPLTQPSTQGERLALEVTPTVGSPSSMNPASPDPPLNSALEDASSQTTGTRTAGAGRRER